jgi:hypothetical protein
VVLIRSVYNLNDGSSVFRFDVFTCFCSSVGFADRKF